VDLISTGAFRRSDIEKIGRVNFTDNNRVRLLWKGMETFQEIFGAIKEGKNLICLEFYIFRDDETGRELAEILKQKSREGVAVCLLYDHFGSFTTSSGFWDEMKKAGVRLRASYPFKWLSPMHYTRRDHKKLIIVDNTKAFTGGLNIANEYSGYFGKRKKPWRDTGIILEGPIVSELLKIFNKSWQLWDGEPISFSPQRISDEQKSYPQNEGVSAVPIFADSSKGRRRMRKLLYFSIQQSRHSIFLTTAYFVPSRRMIEALANAVERGVKVKLLLPGESDVAAAQYAGRFFFKRLLRAGVEIYNYKGEILHAKTAVFDSCWSIIGSANLDFQSLRRNDEGNVGILDEGFGKQMTDLFMEDLNHSIKIGEDGWSRRSVYEKALERFFSLFRRRL